jgi:hypothetical protein
MCTFLLLPNTAMVSFNTHRFRFHDFIAYQEKKFMHLLSGPAASSSSINLHKTELQWHCALTIFSSRHKEIAFAFCKYQNI